MTALKAGRQRGAVVTLLLVLLIVFAVIFIASIGSISRQSHQTVEQEQKEQSFGLADAGVNYTLWLLHQEGQQYTPQNLQSSPPASAVQHEVYDEEGEFVGTFSIEFLQATDSSLQIRSVGRDAQRGDLCQAVEAEVEETQYGVYQVASWDHLLGYDCGGSACASYSIRKGQTVSGELTDNDCASQYASGKGDRYTYEGAAGEELHVHAESSDFSPYLSLISPSGDDIVALKSAPWGVLVAWAGVNSCDNGGACIATDGSSVTLPEDGTYEIEVAWDGSGEQSQGLYTLSLPTQCSDGIDNDGDGAADYPDDFACASAADDDEGDVLAACQDSVDNDGDTFIDHDDDPGCTSPQDNDELGTALCDNGGDDDSDGKIDYPDDRQCDSPEDGSEAPDTTHVCSDAQDNDGDGLIDYPDDPECTSGNDPTEAPACSDGIDNDGDGRTDYGSGADNDPGCASLEEDNELGDVECDNGVDDDSDGAIDYPDDQQCVDPADDSELPACSDGIDNDGDEAIDYPDDFACASATDDDEGDVLAACQDGIDNDGDEATDYPADPGCDDAQQNSELGSTQCDNGQDDDSDGTTDYPDDQQCDSPADESELPQCSDGIDNDGDGLTDYLADPSCDSSTDDDETEVPGSTCQDHVITYDQAEGGNLAVTDCAAQTDPPGAGGYADNWKFEGSYGEMIQVEVRGITDIEPNETAYVYLLDPYGEILYESSYCSGDVGGPSACLPPDADTTGNSLFIDEDGTYTVVVTSMNSGVTYDYSLLVELTSVEGEEF